MSLHEDMPLEVNKVFVSQPSDQGGGNLDPPGVVKPLGYFGLQWCIQAGHHYHQIDLIIG